MFIIHYSPMFQHGRWNSELVVEVSKLGIDQTQVSGKRDNGGNSAMRWHHWQRSSDGMATVWASQGSGLVIWMASPMPTDVPHGDKWRRKTIGGGRGRRHSFPSNPLLRRILPASTLPRALSLAYKTHWLEGGTRSGQHNPFKQDPKQGAPWWIFNVTTNLAWDTLNSATLLFALGF